ncbi:hypothetical protein SDC9_46009 [bioreactor metagenome]|uniref:Signal transduction histidine kinase internal region domain-containing protein n=1 Tax=bioreactor metagenome TaxID=1076179 RepID=A0A644W873_9ZZZZ
MIIKNIRNLTIPLLHFLGWFIFFMSPFITFPLNITIGGDRLTQHSVLTSSLAIVFYLNYLLLIPYVFKTKKYFLYCILALSLCFAFSAIDDYIFMKTTRGPMYERTLADGPPPEIIIEKPRREPGPFQGVTFFATITILSLGLKMTSEWIKAEKKKRELENEKLKIELMALKAQINPHFFFNVMNSLCSLARKKSDDTEKYIIKLSEIFRYNLNDLSQDKVRLSKELDFINNYIDIQYMRNPLLKPVIFDVNGNTDSVTIEPMLLFPFIENAFKHGASGSQPLIVRIKLEIIDKMLHFRIENSVPNGRSSVSQDESAGIGQQNARRRLDILYPDKHGLLFATHNNTYIADLNLDLS